MTVEAEAEAEAEVAASAEAEPEGEVEVTRYERQWDEYSRFWDRDPYFRSFAHLGDEWGDDDWIRYNIATFVAPHVGPDSDVVEIGPGGGRYTAAVLPKCRSLVGVDVSSEMLARLDARFGEEPRASFVKGDGHGLQPLADESADFVFSFNCFVGMEIEDVHAYLREIRRVLRPGGRCALHYADISGVEGWRHFDAHRERWARDPGARGRFHALTLHTVDLLVERAGLVVCRNQVVARDAMVVAMRPSDAAPGRTAAPGETRRDYRQIDQYLDRLAEDVYHEEPTAHHAAAAHAVVDEMTAGLDVETVLELGCGAAPALDRFKARGVKTLGVSLGAEVCDHPVVAADMHFSGLPAACADLVIARHALEHSVMPLLMLMEMHRLTRRYALVVVPCDDPLWVDWHNHYSVLSKPMWNKLFRRAGFRVAEERDGPLEPDSVEWRFLLEKVD